MSTLPEARLICAVVVARNEAATVGLCLAAARRALDSVGGGEILLVDSASTDRTVDIGLELGCRVLAVRSASRVCPAAMRYLGVRQTRSRYILFLDGDCELESGFLPAALKRLEADESLGVIAGGRRDFYRTNRGLIPAKGEYYSAGSSSIKVRPAYGGSALYSRKALEEAGSFDPFLRAKEEQDLGQRIMSAGYKIEILPIPMIRHMTVPRESARRLLRSLNHGFFVGRGQAMRKFLSRGEVKAALHGLGKVFLTWGHLGVGVGCVVAWLEGHNWPLIAWACFSFAAFAAFAARSRGFSRAAYYVAEWLVQGICLGIGFVAPQRAAGSFRWEGEEITSRGRQARELPRVLLVGPLPPPPLKGGVEKGVDLLLRGDLARGTQMRLFNTSRPLDPSRSLWRKLKYQFGTILRYRQTLKNHGVDLVHVKTSSGINFLQNSLYALFARLAGLPVLLQIHSGRFEVYYLGCSAPIRAWIRHTLCRSTRVVVLSKSWADLVASIAPKARIQVIPNGLPREEMRRLASRMGKRAGQVFFLGTGRADLNRDKGLDDLLACLPDLWLLHKHSRWVIAGLADPDATYGELRGRGVDPVGAEPRVHCMGIVTTEIREQILRESTILALPSHFENMPNILLEAMAAGLGVVASDVGAIREMIREGGGILVPPGDHKALSNALEQLLASPALAEVQGRRNSETISCHYTMDVVEAGLENLYLELSGGPRKSRDTSRPEAFVSSDPIAPSSRSSPNRPMVRR